MALDIKTAAELATLIPLYNGDPNGLRSFTDAVNLAKTIVPAENKQAAIQIILTKLSGKARNLFSDTPNEYDEIIRVLKTNCGEKGNSDLVTANLKNLKFKPGDNIQNFTKQVDLLADKLAETFIREQIPSDVARKMSQKTAIQTLINGSTNKETKMMLKIGKFDNLQEAINVMVENDNPENNIANATILQTSTKYPVDNRNRNGFQNQNRFYRNPQTQYRYHERTQPQRYQFNQRNSNRDYRSNQNYRQNNGNRNNPRNGNFNRYDNRQRNPARIYYMQPQNLTTQQMDDHQVIMQEQPSYAQVVNNNIPTNNSINQQLPPDNTNNNYFLAHQ